MTEPVVEPEARRLTVFLVDDHADPDRGLDRIARVMHGRDDVLARRVRRRTALEIDPEARRLRLDGRPIRQHDIHPQRRPPAHPTLA